MTDKIDIKKIKLTYKDVPSAGKQIYAFLGQEIPCVEFTMRGDKDQPVMITHRDPPEFLVFYERWIQFEPEIWSQMVEDVFKEMVKLWNKKYGGDSAEEQAIGYCVDIFNDYTEEEVSVLPPSIIGAWKIGKENNNG